MLSYKRYTTKTDEQLMRKAAHGSEPAFEQLYNRHARSLEGFFFRRLGGDTTLAADFMLDTFQRLYSARESYEEGRNFREWLFSIAYHLCQSHHRKQHPSLYACNDPGEGIFAQFDFERPVEVNLSETVLHDVLPQVLKSLPESYAMLFSLHYEEELTIPQIAQITSLTDTTVKSRLQIIINTIKQKLKQYENH